MSTHRISTYHRQKSATEYRNAQLPVELPRILESVRIKLARFVELDERSATTRDPLARFVRRLAPNVYGRRMIYHRKSLVPEFAVLIYEAQAFSLVTRPEFGRCVLSH